MIIKLSQLRGIRKSTNKKIVFAGGCFDLFHRGHIEALKNLGKYGDYVVIAVSSDKRVRQRKGSKRPILSEKDRVVLIDAIKFVDYTILAPEPAKNKPVPTMQILERLRPDFFVTVDKRWLEFNEDIERCGVELKVIPRVKIYSTTRIIKRIIRRYGDFKN